MPEPLREEVSAVVLGPRRTPACGVPRAVPGPESTSAPLHRTDAGARRRLSRSRAIAAGMLRSQGRSETCRTRTQQAAGGVRL